MEQKRRKTNTRLNHAQERKALFPEICVYMQLSILMY